MSDRKVPAEFRMLGSADAAACVDGVCEIPGADDLHEHAGDAATSAGEAATSR